MNRANVLSAGGMQAWGMIARGLHQHHVDSVLVGQTYDLTAPRRPMTDEERRAARLLSVCSSRQLGAFFWSHERRWIRAVGERDAHATDVPDITEACAERLRLATEYLAPLIAECSVGANGRIASPDFRNIHVRREEIARRQAAMQVAR